MKQELRPTCDRKTRFRPSQKNTFGLLPGPQGTCPGATVGCGGCSEIPAGRKLPVCYVFGLMSAYKGVKPILQHNTDLLKSASQADRISILKQEFERFEKHELKQQLPELFYRLHWSGDVYDEDYADALIEAMNAFPHIAFWNYTRSHDLALDLADNVPNLTQYLSLDAMNFERGMDIYVKWLQAPRHQDANLHICYMSDEDDFAARYAECRTRHQDWPAQPVALSACPVDTKKLPTDGACAKCRKCLAGKPVWFKTK